MRVSVIGPGLGTREYFHVHREGCADLRKYRGRPVESIDVATRRLAAEWVYPPDEFEFWATDPDSYIHDLWFAPCVKDLPYDKEG